MFRSIRSTMLLQKLRNLDFFGQMVQTVIISVLIRCTSRNTGREGRLVMREIRAVASSDVVK